MKKETITKIGKKAYGLDVSFEKSSTLFHFFKKLLKKLNIDYEIIYEQDRTECISYNVSDSIEDLSSDVAEVKIFHGFFHVILEIKTDESNTKKISEYLLKNCKIAKYSQKKYDLYSNGEIVSKIDILSDEILCVEFEKTNSLYDFLEKLFTTLNIIVTFPKKDRVDSLFRNISDWEEFSNKEYCIEIIHSCKTLILVIRSSKDNLKKIVKYLYKNSKNRGKIIHVPTD